MQWFEVDRKGLAQLLERKGKEFVLFELIQNAWDERTSEVRVELERLPGTRNAVLRVVDDNPEGFHDLSHAFTLFADSRKKGQADKRGRFNLGEKLVLALCESAEISTTTGTVEFDGQGRSTSRRRTRTGSAFTGVLRMTNEELERCARAVNTLIPPPGVATYFNGQRLAERTPAARIEATLATEIADPEGRLRPTQRKTWCEFHEPRAGEVPTLYEMGVPVVATGDRWHINVAQKIPLNLDRDNVTPAYLARVRALAVETMRDHLTGEDANAAWVREAFQRHGSEMQDSTVRQLTRLRFGDKCVAYDPSDPEANHLAVSRGYQLVHGSQLTKGEWDSVRRAAALLPAGQVTPSPKAFSDSGPELRLLAEAAWTPAIRRVVAYAAVLGRELLGREVDVQVACDSTWWPAATYGSGRLTLNLGKLGHRWFDGSLERINALLLHEFGHEFSGNHLSGDYHDALTTLGARLGTLALERAEMFDLARYEDAQDGHREQGPRPGA